MLDIQLDDDETSAPPYFSAGSLEEREKNPEDFRVECYKTIPRARSEARTNRPIGSGASEWNSVTDFALAK